MNADFSHLLLLLLGGLIVVTLLLVFLVVTHKIDLAKIEQSFGKQINSVHEHIAEAVQPHPMPLAEPKPSTPSTPQPPTGSPGPTLQMQPAPAVQTAVLGAFNPDIYPQSAQGNKACLDAWNAAGRPLVDYQGRQLDVRGRPLGVTPDLSYRLRDTDLEHINGGDVYQEMIQVPNGRSRAMSFVADAGWTHYLAVTAGNPGPNMLGGVLDPGTPNERSFMPINATLGGPLVFEGGGAGLRCPQDISPGPHTFQAVAVGTSGVVNVLYSKHPTTA